MTKEWYQTMTDSGLGIQLRADDRAAVFSEEFFQSIWEKKCDDMLAMREDVCYEYDMPWDEEDERRYFEENYRREEEIFRTRTPAKILSKVADIRVLALGYCSAEVYRDFEEYRALCEKQTEKTMEEAWELQRAQGLDKIWTGGHSLHDSLVQSVKREGEDLVIEFEAEDPEERLADIRENDPELLEEMGEAHFLFLEIKAIRFRDAEILKREQPLENAWWLYDEIWKSERGYEIHALLWQENDVFELTIECREPELIWTVEPKQEV